MCFTKKDLIKILFIVIIILFVYYIHNKSENFNSQLYSFNSCPNNCVRESKNDSLLTMCNESCNDIYKKCPDTCYIVGQFDSTNTVIPKCQNNCDKDLNVCLQKCKSMTPKCI